MGSPQQFWDNIAPYLYCIEDNFLDLESIRKLESHISNPVLVVGAGQGLLVEELHKNGFTVDGIDNNPKMIEYAEKRRGIKLIQADATNLPFNNKSYGTTIIATGVVDYMDDEQLIVKIINEAMRVTVNNGNVLVAFYKIHPASEDFQKRIGLITNDNTLRHRYVFEFIRLKPKDVLRRLKKDANMGLFSAIGHLIKMTLVLSTKERKNTKVFAEMVKNMDDPDAFIESCPDSIPYRTSPIIHALFDRHGFNIKETYVYDSCTVIKIDNNVMTQ